MAISVILADDQEVIRKGLVCLLADQDLQIVAQASTCQEAIDATKANKPDVLLLDVLMPDMDGLDALELIRFARSAVEADDYDLAVQRLQDAMERLQ